MGGNLAGSLSWKGLLIELDFLAPAAGDGAVWWKSIINSSHMFRVLLSFES